MADNTQLIRDLYQSMQAKHEEGRKHFGRPLTLAEKILVGHLKQVCDEDGGPLKRKVSYANLFPDRVAMQDATAQMALLQFMHSGRDAVAVPSTVHCDHLIRAHKGSKQDLVIANDENQEVYAFLESVSAKYGIGFWKPGAGIIHQVVLENYAFPGGMMIGTDSHTPNAGGLGMVAIGIGGADAVDVMAGLPFNLRWPGVIGVKLTGKLSGWTSPKDVILKLMGILTVKGGTGHIVEFFGDGCNSISGTGKGTITNMGAEHGATTSVFPFDEAMGRYLRSTERAEWADLATTHADALRADPEVEAEPEKFYDRVIHIDLSTLEPHWVGPHTPDLSRAVGEMKAAVQSEDYDDDVKAALIGSCTNSSYEDLSRAAFLAKSAAEQGIRAKVPFMVTPGSESVHLTIQRDGQMSALQDAGGVVLANACGPCIGQWQRDDIQSGDKNTIVTSFNRNFRGRNDANRETNAFIGSPEMVTAIALSGSLSFNPLQDTLKTADGRDWALPEPEGDELPKSGFVADENGYLAPASDGASIQITIAPDSERLSLLERFDAWSGEDYTGLPILFKAQGKCTTDHISAAGRWLRFRGHLDQIANNTYMAAVNAFGEGETVGQGFHVEEKDWKPLPALARDYKNNKISWVVFGDENFGEGSSREHAAMQPRHLGGKAIIVRSFARIHETNLKKQGILPLTFDDPADYAKVLIDDRVDVVGLAQLTPGQKVKIILNHQDGTQDEFLCNHTLSDEQIQWFRAGSALNYIANQNN
jgi:aconitate hydratase